MRKNHLLFLLGFTLYASMYSLAQSCTPQGDQTTYGTNNVWIGYVYDNPNFTTYMGYINMGSASDPGFDLDFGGSYENYPTHGCTVYTESFSVRFKLTQTFAPGSYEITASADDVIRFSLDGGATWIINNWAYNGYTPSTITTTLSGSYNMVMEYADGAHKNKVFFSIKPSCSATPGSNTYGTGGTWIGYFYSGINFDRYKGSVNQPSVINMHFTQNFGGAKVDYPTSNCPVFTDFFSVRYQLQYNFSPGSYTITVSGDDKYRLSLDGGSTWVIDRWIYNDGNSSRMYTSNLNGNYNLVLDYYDKDGSNEIQISSARNYVLPINLVTFTGKRVNNGVVLNWSVQGNEDVKDFEIERSENGQLYQHIGTVSAIPGKTSYVFTDLSSPMSAAYYRLKWIDDQGKSSYSKPIGIINGANETKIYPTFVSNSTIYLTNNKAIINATLDISDMSGRALNSRRLGNLSEGQTTSVFLADLGLPKGIYILQLSSGRQMLKTEKIIIQ